MRILITMSRTWLDFEATWRDLDEEMRKRPGEVIVVVHGGASPEKRVIDEWVQSRSGGGWRVRAEEHPARWTEEGRKAGIMRNLRMVELGADLCLAYIYDNSRGATHCSTAAHQAGIETRITRFDSA